jgi:isopentenyl diphosphate isomerase/L-lactate dehydrogenase-like FMN-dependent dehydrogenase
MGGTGTGAAFKENIEALAAYKLNLRTIHEAKEPNTQFELFGKKLETPVIAAPITGAKINMGGFLTEAEYIEAVIQGSMKAGSVGMSGDTGDPTIYTAGLDAIKRAGGFGIPFIKPREQSEIISRLQLAQEAGAFAAGVDVDGAGLVIMKMLGQPVGPKSPAEIKELTTSTELPFIVKGIMTVDEAEMAVEAGAKGIVVSNHGGRVLDHTPGAADVLPEIVEAVKGQVVIMVDGGVRTGTDVLKYLALGADCVLVGRPVIIGAVGGYAEGVQLTIDKLTAELKQAMILTGCADLASINETVIF